MLGFAGDRSLPMGRLTTSFLFGAGVLILVTWVVASASSPPQEPRRESAGSPPPALPELDAINREVDRLRERLATPAPESTPQRDPFQFEDTATPDTGIGRPQDVAVDTPAEPVLQWPVLVAILESGDEAQPSRRAVFEDTRQLIQIRSTGETLGGFSVTAVDADVVSLTHITSGQSVRLSVR